MITPQENLSNMSAGALSSSSESSTRTTSPQVQHKTAFQGGAAAYPFPWQLHECLATAEAEGLEHVISWKPHGRCFSVHKPDDFVKLLMPRFFKQTKFASFMRQLNLYGFLRLHTGQDKGCYYNLCFVRGHQTLARRMVRQKIKGYRVQRASPAEEPNFYLPQWKGHFEASLPPALQDHQSSVLPPSVTTPAVVFVPVPEKAMTSVSMLSSLCQPFALGNPSQQQNGLASQRRMPKISPSHFFGRAFETPPMNFSQENQSPSSSSSAPQSCKDILSLALDECPEPQSSAFVSLESLPEAIDQLFTDELVVDEFEPIPLRQGAQQAVIQQQHGDVPSFRLVDADRNIFSL